MGFTPAEVNEEDQEARYVMAAETEMPEADCSFVFPTNTKKGKKKRLLSREVQLVDPWINGGLD